MSFFELPDTALIGGEEIPILTDFRNGVRLSLAVCDESLTPDELTLLGLSLFFGNDSRAYRFMDEALENLLFFFSGGKQPDAADTIKSAAKQNAVYDFESDEGLIASAFEATYGIDLYAADMHWWRFLRLLEPLASGIDFPEVIQCRTAKKVSKERRAYVNQVKVAYPLPDRHAKKRAAPQTADDFKERTLAKKKKREQEILQRLREENKS